MAAPTITALPPAPVRGDAPDDFTAKANAMIGALGQMVTETNTSMDFVNTKAIEAEQNAQSTASDVQSTATNKQAAQDAATTATNQAGIATTQAGLAADAKTEAESARDIAIAKADEAASSAASIDMASLMEMIASATPAGTVITTAMTTAPSGYLKCDGSEVSRSTYPGLFTAIGTTFGDGDGATTFTLPDMRGVFARGFDDGRGIDSERVFGSYQEDDNKEHSHTGSTSTTGAHTHSTNIVASSGYIDSWKAVYLEAGSTKMTTSSSGNHSHSLNINNSGGSESRPKNIALLYCIKY